MYTGFGCIHSCGVLVRVVFCVLYGLGWPGLVGDRSVLLSISLPLPSEKEKQQKEKDTHRPGLFAPWPLRCS